MRCEKGHRYNYFVKEEKKNTKQQQQKKIVIEEIFREYHFVDLSVVKD